MPTGECCLERVSWTMEPDFINPRLGFLDPCALTGSPGWVERVGVMKGRCSILVKQAPIQNVVSRDTAELIA